ncbi:MAG: enoyl-CoA hydratase/isomerase family protein [Acidimicrobiia bacterium]|nr:enoyl-CoA hydratase/isomerase family protein [Acidimicrobiia bacterium]
MPVRYEVDGRVATITIDRPEAMNALDPPMLFGLAEAWDRATEDDNVWVVVLTGAGDDAFCVGADLKSTVPRTAADARGERDGQQERWPSMARTLLRDRFFPKPIVAAVNGHCIAGGFGLLLATDLRYASTNAMFGMQEVRWGLFPIAGSTVNLPRQVPYCKAMEGLLIGDRIDAHAALAMGLVNEVVEHSEVRARAREIADRLCRNGPLAVRKVKEAVVLGLGLPMAQAFQQELRLAQEVYASADAVEGPAAFAEKREPRFSGK